MKKINICISEQDAMDGFVNISISQIDQIANGSVDDIVLKILNKLNYDQAKNTIIQVCKKLKNKGLLTIEILDILAICKDVFKGTQTSKSISEKLREKESFLYEQDLYDLIENFPQFNIKNKYKNNDHIVFVIYKELKND